MTVPAVAPLERRTLREQALTSLRGAITGGVLTPGTRLVETELSAALHVSRGTLREALRALEQEGLVEVDGGRMAVRTLSRQQTQDVFTVRAALEGLATRLLCECPERDEVVTALRDALQQMVGCPDLTSQAEADLAFHHLLCRLTGNEMLVQSWEFLSGHVRLSIMRAGPERAMHNMNVERHRPLVDAIERGDADGAADFVQHHMREASDRLVLGP